jgi:hypothetical protein
MVITAGTERQRQVTPQLVHMRSGGGNVLKPVIQALVASRARRAMQHTHLAMMCESKQVVPPEQRDLAADQAAADQSDPAMVHQTAQTEPLLFGGSPVLPPRPPKPPPPPIPPRRVMVPWRDNASTYFLEQDLDGNSKTVLVAMVQCLLCVSNFYCLKDSDGGLTGAHYRQEPYSKTLTLPITLILTFTLIQRSKRMILKQSGEKTIHAAYFALVVRMQKSVLEVNNECYLTAGVQRCHQSC